MSSKIDGMLRELLEDMLNPCADFATHDKLRALLDAPVVERPQIRNASEVAYNLQAELAELQATIAQLTTENEAVKFNLDKTDKRYLAAVAEIERLKGGQGEPFMYGIAQPDGKPHYSELCVSGEASDLESEVESMNEDGDGGYRVVALYTSQPAPVSVVLPIRQPEQNCDYTKGWNACLDQLKELNQ